MLKNLICKCTFRLLQMQEVVTTFSINTEWHITGRTANDWYRIEQSEGDVYISGKLLGTEKSVIQQQSTGGNNHQSPVHSDDGPPPGTNIGDGVGENEDGANDMGWTI